MTRSSLAAAGCSDRRPAPVGDERKRAGGGFASDGHAGVTSHQNRRPAQALDSPDGRDQRQQQCPRFIAGGVPVLGALKELFEAGFYRRSPVRTGLIAEPPCSARRRGRPAPRPCIAAPCAAAGHARGRSGCSQTRGCRNLGEGRRRIRSPGRSPGKPTNPKAMSSCRALQTPWSVDTAREAESWTRNWCAIWKSASSFLNIV
jgi:hypothetical protein